MQQNSLKPWYYQTISDTRWVAMFFLESNGFLLETLPCKWLLVNVLLMVDISTNQYKRALFLLKRYSRFLWDLANCYTPYSSFGWPFLKRVNPVLNFRYRVVDWWRFRDCCVTFSILMSINSSWGNQEFHLSVSWCTFTKYVLKIRIW